MLAWAGWVWLLACQSTGSSVSPWLYLASSNSLALLLSPQLVQETLEAFNIGPFQADGELLCMSFLQPSDDPPSADGVGSRPWEAFRRVLEDLGEHTDQTQSVIPSEEWKQWFLGLDERVPFPPSDASDLERSLWLIMEKVTCGKPSYTFTPKEYGWFFFCGAVRARSSDGHQSICKDCPFPRMRKSETIPKVSLETKATSNKQKQHKTATNHKQQTNNPGHLAKKVKHYAFRSIPLSLSTAPRRNSNITHSHPTCSKVIITCDDDTSRSEPLLNVVVYATHCNHLDKTSYHRQHPE